MLVEQSPVLPLIPWEHRSFYLNELLQIDIFLMQILLVLQNDSLAPQILSLFNVYLS
jgi:hypothetical protein